MNLKKISLSKYSLQLIAIICMVLDHTARVWVPYDSVLGVIMHTFGKVTGPIMFFFIAEGYQHTKNIKKYLVRLGIFALISQVPFSLFINNGSFFPFTGNVLFTLMMALMTLIIYDRVEEEWLKWVMISLLAMVSVFSDWGIYGILITVSFGIFKDRKTAFSMYGVVNVLKILVSAFQVSFAWWNLLPQIISPLLVLGLLCLYKGRKGMEKAPRLQKIAGWALYAFYPLHLAVLVLILMV